MKVSTTRIGRDNDGQKYACKSANRNSCLRVQHRPCQPRLAEVQTGERRDHFKQADTRKILVHMSYSLNSLKGLFRVLHGGVFGVH